MTTASSCPAHRFRYRCNAFTTTAVTVVPSAFAFSTAARHTSSGMRSERGIVATSADRGASGDAEVSLGLGGRAARLADVSEDLGLLRGASVRGRAAVVVALHPHCGEGLAGGAVRVSHLLSLRRGVYLQSARTCIYMSTPPAKKVQP